MEPPEKFFPPMTLTVSGFHASPTAGSIGGGAATFFVDKDVLLRLERSGASPISINVLYHSHRARTHFAKCLIFASLVLSCRSPRRVNVKIQPPCKRGQPLCRAAKASNTLKTWDC